MEVGEAVRERILALCRERNISINKLCSLSGVTQSTVNNIISGPQSQRHNFHHQKAVRRP